MLTIKREDEEAWCDSLQALNEKLIPTHSVSVEAFGNDHECDTFEITLTHAAAGRCYRQSYFIERVRHKGWVHLVVLDAEDFFESPIGYSHPFHAVESYFAQRLREMVNQAITIQRANQRSQ